LTINVSLSRAGPPPGPASPTVARPRRRAPPPSADRPAARYPRSPPFRRQPSASVAGRKRGQRL